MRYGLCVAFSESREYGQVQNQYHDAHRGQLAATSRRTFTPSQRLTATKAAGLSASLRLNTSSITTSFGFDLLGSRLGTKEESETRA